MGAKDNAYCGYNVGEAEKYGLIKAIILNQIRWYLRTLGKQFDGQKCWRTVKDLADDIGIPYDTVRKNLPTEEMGIKCYHGYKPGTMTRTTWWEECPKNGRFATSEATAEVTSKEMTAEVTSYNKRRKKEENPLEVTSSLQAKSFSSFCSQKAEGGSEADAEADTPLRTESFSSFCSQKAEGGSEADAEAVIPPDFPDVVDLKKAKQRAPAIGYGFAEELLRAAGKKDKAGGRLISQLRTLNKRYSKEELMEVARKSKFDSFWAKSPAISLFSEAGVGAMLNKDNKAENIFDLPKDDPRRVEYMKNHPELW